MRQARIPMTGICGMSMSRTYEVKGLPVTPYLVPQDCGMHMDTQWVKVRRSRVLDNRRQGACAQALRFQLEDGAPFAFSCLPYTAAEL